MVECKDCDSGKLHYHYPSKEHTKKMKAHANEKGMNYNPKHNRELIHGHTDEYEAAKGFHGYVDHPTHFLVGEHGKERVNITPIKGNKKIHHDRKNKNYYDVDLQDVIGKFW